MKIIWKNAVKSLCLCCKFKVNQKQEALAPWDKIIIRAHYPKQVHLLDLHNNSGFWDSEFLYFYQSIQQKEKPRLAAQSTVL